MDDIDDMYDGMETEGKYKSYGESRGINAVQAHCEHRSNFQAAPSKIMSYETRSKVAMKKKLLFPQLRRCVFFIQMYTEIILFCEFILSDRIARVNVFTISSHMCLIRFNTRPGILIHVGNSPPPKLGSDYSLN